MITLIVVVVVVSVAEVLMVVAINKNNSYLSTILNTLHIIIHLILTTNPQGWY